LSKRQFPVYGAAGAALVPRGAEVLQRLGQAIARAVPTAEAVPTETEVFDPQPAQPVDLGLVEDIATCGAVEPTVVEQLGARIADFADLEARGDVAAGQDGETLARRRAEAIGQRVEASAGIGQLDAKLRRLAPAAR